LAEADDRTVWKYAGENGFAIVSLDADFADLATLLGPPPKVIWLRCGNQPTAMVDHLIRRHAVLIAAFDADLAACLEIY
jgi:predicted nuclease of predicted toxin-antitoxin system